MKKQYVAKSTTWKKPKTSKRKSSILKKAAKTLNHNPEAKVVIVAGKLENKKTAGKKAASLNSTIRKKLISKVKATVRTKKGL